MKRLLFSTIFCMGIAMFLASPVCAKVAGVCSNCHTMHNSQDGSHMMINTTIDGTSGGTHGGGYPSLTRGTCVGCHSGDDVTDGPIPFVNTLGGSAPTTYLAGGNFWWVAQGATHNAKGHNVKGVPGIVADSLTIAPGGASMCANSCHNTLFAPNATGIGGPAELDTGCQGCHLDPKHHAPQQASNAAATVDNGYFRFLSGHKHIGTLGGVHGIEDSKWQYNADATNHNEYLGSTTSTANTMTGYCIGCHGNFHTQLDGTEWIRHPSDAVLPSTGEYSAYTVYDPIAPVARPDLGAIGAAQTVVPGEDMVMCLSCHRAHGSPYNDLLRWNYETGTIAGGGGISEGTGCFVCHTEKDH
jgi:hypothetical protein